MSFSKLDGPPSTKQEYIFHAGPLVLPLASVLQKPCQLQYPVSSQKESQPEQQKDWSRDCVLLNHIWQNGSHHRFRILIVLPSIHSFPRLWAHFV